MNLVEKKTSTNLPILTYTDSRVYFSYTTSITFVIFLIRMTEDITTILSLHFFGVQRVEMKIRFHSLYLILPKQYRIGFTARGTVFLFLVEMWAKVL